MRIKVVLWAIAILLAYASFRFWRMTRPRQENNVARVAWMVSERPMLVRASVLMAPGVPFTNVEVGLQNNSGWNFATTDSNGYAILHPGELDVTELSVNGVSVAHNPWAMVDRGLEIVILIKETNAIPPERKR